MLECIFKNIIITKKQFKKLNKQIYNEKDEKIMGKKKQTNANNIILSSIYHRYSKI